MIKYLLVAILVLGISLYAVPTAAQEPCYRGTWYENYVQYAEIAAANVYTGEETEDEMINKTFNMYGVQFLMEGLLLSTPICGQVLVRKSAILAGLYADQGMLVLLSGELQMPEVILTQLITQYAALIESGNLSVQMTHEGLELVDDMGS